MRSSQSTDISGAALNHARVETTIPAQEIIALRMMPKMKTIPPSQASSRPDGRTGKLAPMNRQWMKIRRMTITCLSLKTR